MSDVKIPENSGSGLKFVEIGELKSADNNAFGKIFEKSLKTSEIKPVRRGGTEISGNAEFNKNDNIKEIKSAQREIPKNAENAALDKDSRENLKLNAETKESYKMKAFQLGRKDNIHQNMQTKMQIFSEKLSKFTKNAAKNAAKGVAIGAAKVAKGVAIGAAKGAFSTLKSGLKAIDPTAKKINKNDVSDTGIESIRLARETIDKTVSGLKTAKRTLKTTARTVKKIGRAVKFASRVVFKTVKMTVTVLKAIIQITAKIIVHLIAALFNPVVLCAVALIIIVVMSSSLILILMGGGSNSRAEEIVVRAGGLDDVETEYQRGLELLATALENEADGFRALVNATVYFGNSPNSDLIQVFVTNDVTGRPIQYARGYATPWFNQYINETAWEYPISAVQLLAITYVLLQKNANENLGTTRHIYEVSYTSEILSQVVGLSVDYETTIIGGRICPGANCIPGNPPYCNSIHNLHQIRLHFHTADYVMNELNFTAADREWVQLTMLGLGTL